MQKAMLKLILAVFILGVIYPGAGNGVAANTGLNDYYKACTNKQSQVLPLVKYVHTKDNVSSPQPCFAKPFWTGSIPGCPAVSCGCAALTRQSENIHFQRYLQLLLYPPHFFG
ncbi:MAG: hypothetical protein ACTHMI_17135 [Mucilaginibacter sp.]